MLQAFVPLVTTAPAVHRHPRSMKPSPVITLLQEHMFKLLVPLVTTTICMHRAHVPNALQGTTAPTVR
jgi:hypothetical protein